MTSFRDHLHRDLFFPPKSQYVANSQSQVPIQFLHLLRNSNQILSHYLTISNVQSFLSFILKNKDFFFEFLANVERAWDVSEQDDRLINYLSRANPEPNPEFEEAYFLKDTSQLSKSVVRVFWKLFMEFQMNPMDFDRVSFWCDFMAVFGFRNPEVVNKLTLQWLLISEHGQVKVAERHLDFSSFWSGIYESFDSVCAQFQQTPDDPSMILDFLYDASFSLRSMFDVCPLLVWTLLETKHMKNMQPKSHASAEKCIPLLRWIVIIYESILPSIVSLSEPGKHPLLRYKIEQCKQNFQAVIDTILREIFLDTLVKIGHPGKDCSDFSEQLLLSRYFSPLLSEHKEKDLLQKISQLIPKYFSDSLGALKAIGQTKFLKNIENLFFITLQMMSSVTMSFVESFNGKLDTKYGLALAEYDTFFHLIDELEQRKEVGIHSSDSITVIVDTVKSLNSNHRSALEKSSPFFQIPNPGIEKLKRVYPKYGEHFLQSCLQNENGDTEAVITMIDSNQLPSNLQEMNKFQKGTHSSNENQIDEVKTPIPWEETDVFTGEVYIGKKKKPEKLGKLSEAMRRRIMESIQYDDEYDDTYDAINEFPTAGDADEEENLQNVAKINHNADPDSIPAIEDKQRGNKASRHGPKSALKTSGYDDDIQPAGDGKRGRGGRGRRGRGRGRGKKSRRNASKKRMTQLHHT